MRRLEDYQGLAHLVSALPPGEPLLLDIGGKLGSVGLCTEAVEVGCGRCRAFTPPCSEQLLLAPCVSQPCIVAAHLGEHGPSPG